jgi:hypothetical protein
MTATQVELRWRLSPLAARLATVGALASAAGLVLGRAELVVLAVPALAALLAGRRAGLGELGIAAATPSDRYVENDRVDIGITVDPGPATGGFRAELALPATAWHAEGSLTAIGTTEVTTTWSATPTRWGRRSLGPVRLTAWGPSRLDVATAEVSFGVVDVHPPGRVGTALAGPAAPGPADRPACWPHGRIRCRVRWRPAVRARRRRPQDPLAGYCTEGSAPPHQACRRASRGRCRRDRRHDRGC